MFVRVNSIAVKMSNEQCLPVRTYVIFSTHISERYTFGYNEIMYEINVWMDGRTDRRTGILHFSSAPIDNNIFSNIIVGKAEEPG